LKHSGPSKIAEAVVAVLVPPACREEVLGDLHERFKSPWQYTADVLFTVPLVILSRMRRTAEPQILLTQAFALYLSFTGAAWLYDRAVLREHWGLLRLAIPAAMALAGLILDDTYAHPRRRSSVTLARGPVLGIVLALASQAVLRISNPGLSLPRWITFYGCGMSFLLSCAIRRLFAPVTAHLRGANAPALWLKPAGGSRGEKDDPMSSKRKVAITCGLLVIAGGALWMTTKGQGFQTTYTYSQFLDQVHRGQVASVVVTGSKSGPVEASCRMKDGKGARTVLPPDYRDALIAMQDRLVDIEIRDPSREPLRLLMNATPFLLLLGVWTVAMIGKFPHSLRP
jgi:hypothetical protein